MKPTVRFFQIATGQKDKEHILYGLDGNGSIWVFGLTGTDWIQMKSPEVKPIESFPVDGLE